jgi:cobaltochelatase CobS
VRVNLDSHISRIDLVGKDAIVIKDGMQVTEFQDGILPWALQHNTRSSSTNTMPAGPTSCSSSSACWNLSGKLTLLDQRRVIRRIPPSAVRHRQHDRPRRHPGLYHGTQQINQGRWTAGRSSPR